MLELILLWSISECEDVVSLPNAHRGAEYTFQGNPGCSDQNGRNGSTNCVPLLAIPPSHLVTFIILVGRFRSQPEACLTMTRRIYQPIGEVCGGQRPWKVIHK